MEFTREQEKREYSFSDCIYDLLFQSCYAQYVMDQDPEKELEKLAELCPRIYCVLYPVLRRMMNPDDAATLMVYGVPLHACEDDVRESFSSFGEIECVEMERENISQTAYVTYKDSEAAKFAIDLVNPKVCNLDVRVWYIFYYRTLSESKSKYIKAKPSEELFISMHERALKKYSEIIACHAKLQTKEVEAELQANDSESVLKNDVDDICGSMAFEGVVIGKTGVSPEHR